MNGDGLVQHLLGQLLDAPQPFSFWVLKGDRIGRCFRVREALDPASHSSFPVRSWNSGDTIGLIRTGSLETIEAFLASYTLTGRGATDNSGRGRPFRFKIEWPGEIALGEGQVFVLFLHDGDGVWLLRQETMVMAHPAS